MTPDPIKAVCSRKYTACNDSGDRDVDSVRWIVLHSTEGPTAEGAASWFQNPKSRGSAHLVVDDDTCFRTLLNTQIPWAAFGANTKGFHIEQAGYARWSRAEWLAHDRMLRRCAFKIAIHSYLFRVPLRWVGPVSLKAGLKGLTTHAACSAAFGGDHSDPGTSYPKDKLLAYARLYLAEYAAERNA